MHVREILLTALKRVNVANGENANAEMMDKALGYFRSAVRKYGADQLITAYQNVAVVDARTKAFTVGGCVLLKGKILHRGEMPPPEYLVQGRDYLFNDGKFYAWDGSEFVECQPSECCAIAPDFTVFDFGEIVSMSRLEDGRQVKLDFVPLSQFVPIEADDVYTVSNATGCSKSVRVKKPGVFTVVYNENRVFAYADMVDLPPEQEELVVASVCAGCARTAEQRAKWEGEVAKLETACTKAGLRERLPMREVC